MDLIKVYDPNIPRVFAIDNSGSTVGVQLYWNSVRTIIQNFFRNDKDQIILWNSKAEMSNINKLTEVISRRKGTGGTYPSSFVDFDCLHKEDVHLFLITDGEVMSVEECDKKIKSNPLHLAYTTVFIINSSPDLSVCAPFCRNNTSQILTAVDESKFKEEFYVTKSLLETVEVIDEIKTMEQLDSAYDDLYNSLVFKFVGTNGDVGIKEKLIKLRSLLVKHNASEELENSVRSGNFELAVKISKEFPKNNPAAKIDKLISIANGSMKNVFGIGQIKSNRAARAVTVQDMDISDLNDLGDGKPDETPVLILSKLPRTVNSLLSCFDAEKVKKQIDFPLNVLLHISCIKRIQDHVIASIPNSQFMEIDKIQDEVLDDENFYIPMGGIPLGCDPTHVKMANKTIMDFIAGGKKLGNPDFWFATIYFCLEKADPDKSKYAELMVPQLKYRLRKRFSTLSLSGASNFNLTSLPIDISLWYTLNSIYFESDVFNLHASHIKYLQKLYEMTSLMPLDEKVKTAIKVVGAKNYLHKLARTNPLAFESKKNEILYNTVTINLSKMKFEVPIDGVSKYDENSFSMMAKLCQITDRNIACHLIPIPTEIPEIKKEDYQEWKNYKFVPFTIYPKTFRPPVNQCPPFNELKNSNAEVVPWTKIFYKAAKRIKKFPNTNDLAYQTYLEYVKSGKKKTLMPDVLKICSQVEKAYKPAIQGTQVDDFLKIFNMSANREKRMEMENEK